ncbi:MAG: TOPRIM nucleotidyl transferase/hydrolase domain-containing protein [Pedococcus sp.]
MTVSVPEGCRVWVLLEGASDVAALRVVAGRGGISLADQGVHLVDMHGATNIRRHLIAAAEAADSPRVLGMCDAPEAPYFVRALRRVGCAVESADELPWWGFQVCERDLEDELMRDLGEQGIRDVLEALGLTQRLAMLTQQPAWVSGTFHEQVHRFAGAASGRKELMAGAMAEALDMDQLPKPLAGLLDAISRPGPTFAELRVASPDP